MTRFDLDGIGMTSQRTRDRLVKRLRERGISEPRVLQQIGSIPRHIFIDEALAHRAYEDTALPIGFNQTISQPFVVARMSELLCAKKPRRVLEIGTGSGYQTAILAKLFDRVYSVERIAGLMDRVAERLAALELRNVRLHLADGYQGWQVNAPFDAILVTAAPPAIPEALLDQLSVGGRLIAPVGGAHDVQELRVIDRTEKGFDQEVLEYVRFVPLKEGLAK
jgi:protein-L-isoaspartate(D-aspartate) O-methyltransferase